MKNKNIALKNNLFSTDNNIILNTLKEIRQEGNDDILSVVIEVYEKNENQEIKNTIAQLFNDLKNQSSALIVIDQLKNSTNEATKKMLLSSCWQSRLNYLDYLELFIDTIMSANFELSFEAFSVVENIESKTTPQRKTALTNYVNSKLELCKPENLPLAESLIEIIQNYQELE